MSILMYFFLTIEVKSIDTNHNYMNSQPNLSFLLGFRTIHYLKLFFDKTKA